MAVQGLCKRFLENIDVAELDRRQRRVVKAEECCVDVSEAISTAGGVLIRGSFVLATNAKLIDIW